MEIAVKNRTLPARPAARLVRQPPSPRQEMLTVDQVADLLNVHTSTIYRLLKKREIPAFKLGSDWRFSREQIYKWIAQRQRLETL